MLLLLAKTLNTTTDHLLGNNKDSTPLTETDKEEAEFLAFANNPTLQKWYKEPRKSREEAKRCGR